ncbi:MAG: class I SAM-dependent methyltransferase, partial [Verrucomicrobiota bacterium]
MPPPAVEPTPRTPRLRLRVKPAAEAVVRGGHPWLWADSVRDLNRPGEAGELAVVYDRQDRFLALGLFDPDSPLRVRLLHTGKPVQVDAAWWRRRLEAAVDRRRDCLGPDTDGYRIVNGESDGWPGLVLDRYADTLVLKLYSPVWLGAVTDRLGPERLPGLRLPGLIRSVLGPARIVLRLSRNLEVAAAVAGLSNGMTSEEAGEGVRFRAGEDLPVVVFRESGLRFEADPQRGQKTGFFLDQRENRRKVGGLSAGAEVLNAFSFSGGFSLYAARGGARTVVDLDLSPHALASARRNFALNREVPAVAAA